MKTRWLQFFPLVVGAALFGLALPTFAARVAMLSGDRAVEKLYEGGALSDAEKDSIRVSRQRALLFMAPSTVARDLALLAARDVEADVSALSQEKLFTQDRVTALAAQWRDLAQTPVNPYGWARVVDLLPALSSGENETWGRGANILKAQALALSFDSAPYEPRLLVARLRRVVSLWYDLPRTRSWSLSNLVQQAWAYDKAGVARAAREGNFVTLVESVLIEKPEELKEFHALLRSSLREE